MLRKLLSAISVLAVCIVSGCASVPMESHEVDSQLKSFAAPQNGNAGVYIYRNSFVGQALKKTISLNGVAIGESSNKVYFYKEVAPGEHTLSTESEFGDNSLKFTAEAGRNYFFEQYIKMGVFVGGANLKAVSEAEGQAGVAASRLARSY